MFHAAVKSENALEALQGLSPLMDNVRSTSPSQRVIAAVAVAYNPYDTTFGLMLDRR